jgi:hypothetical protein
VVNLKAKLLRRPVFRGKKYKNSYHFFFRGITLNIKGSSKNPNGVFRASSNYVTEE